MGVFARIFRSSKTTEEAQAAESRTGTPDPERAPKENTAAAAEPAVAGPRNTVRPAEAGEAAEAADSESVGIPKQQSAGEAVDNETDKGART